MSIPEPKSFNGDRDDDPMRYGTGQRREEPSPASYYGQPCGTCGRPCHRIYTLADVGVFCSAGCRSKATEPAQSQGAA